MAYSTRSAWRTLDRWPWLHRHVNHRDPYDFRPSGKPAANPAENDSCLLADLETALEQVPLQYRPYTIRHYRDDEDGATLSRNTQLTPELCLTKAKRGAWKMVHFLTGIN